MSAQFLSRWGVIGVEGEDAVSFLHAQLSNDVAGLAENQLRLAGLCTAKGRLVGSFFVLRRAQQVFLVCRKDTIATVVKRLNMFVLRSKCTIKDCSANYQLAFVPNSCATATMQVQWNNPDKNLVAATASLRTLNGVIPGFQLLQGADATDQTAGDDAFEHVLQQLGIAYVSLPIVEMFTPQAINFDLVGAVSFTKGCYPGQEVVARSHYLGKAKRRVFQANTQGATVSAGQDVWLTGKDHEPAGVVVTAVCTHGQCHLLVELTLDDAQNREANFKVRNEHGETPLSVTPPPYDVHQKGNLFEQI